MMKHEKIVEALKECARLLEEVGLGPCRCEATRVTPNMSERGAHALWMALEAATWPPERREKAMRWLGFVQGVLWSQHVATIEQLKKMNMPDEPETLDEMTERLREQSKHNVLPVPGYVLDTEK